MWPYTPNSVSFRTAALYNYFIQHTQTCNVATECLVSVSNTPASYLVAGSNLTLQTCYPDQNGFPQSLQADVEIIP